MKFEDAGAAVNAGFGYPKENRVALAAFGRLPAGHRPEAGFAATHLGPRLPIAPAGGPLQAGGSGQAKFARLTGFIRAALLSAR